MEVVRILGLLAMIGGCRQVLGLDDPRDAGGIITDGKSIDAVGTDGKLVDGAPGTCFGTGLVDVCFQQPPSGSLVLQTQTINTDTSSLCSTTVVSGANGACVVAAVSIDIPAAAVVTGIGTRPLVLVAADTLTVTGTLDVSDQPSGVAAGADFAGCNTASSASSTGGGAGGSMGGRGGNGGAPSPSTAGAILSPTAFHGGCPGASGSPGGLSGGGRGHGGGATYLIGGVHVDVPGTIDASGGGGSGGQDDNVGGGGGGGSGGMIGLDAPMITLSGTVFANGGGGGEGSGSPQQQGHTGSDSIAGAVAGGGTGASGSDGGNGAAGVTLVGGLGVDGGIAGGGGGGGAGVIKATGTVSGTGLVSPPMS